MHDKHSIAAVILAAGASSRMGYPKALLKIDNSTFVDILIAKINQAGISNINVVLGSEPYRILSCLNTDSVSTIINKKWQAGQLSSLKCAVKTLSNNEAIIVLLIDNPMVEVSTIISLCESYEKGTYDVVIPQYNGGGGHPVIYSQRVFEQLLDLPDSEGARALYKNRTLRILRKNVDDRYVKQDIDTKQDFCELDDRT